MALSGADPFEHPTETINENLIAGLNFVDTFNNNLPLALGHFSHSQHVANALINQFVQDGSTLLYEIYLRKKLPNFLREMTSEQLNTLVREDNMIHDDDIGNTDHGISIEDELEPPRIDTWGRSKVSKAKEENEEAPKEDLFSDQNPNLIAENKIGFTKAKLKAHKFLNEVKKDECPRPIALPSILESAAWEDQLRHRKDQQNKKKTDDEEQKKREEDELREIHNKLKNGPKEKAKAITFDYEGRPITINQIKSDKLPPAQWPVKSQIYYILYLVSAGQFSTTDAFAKNRKMWKGGPVGASPNKNKGKKASEGEREIPNNFVSSHPPFEYFDMAPGVSLNENGKVKQGMRNTNYGSLTMTNTTNTSSKIQLSKIEYMSMTRGGNHSRGQGLVPPPDATLQASVPNHEGLSKTNSRRGTLQESFQQQSRGPSPKKNESPQTKEQEERNKVTKSDSKKLLETLLKQNNEPEAKESVSYILSQYNNPLLKNNLLANGKLGKSFSGSQLNKTNQSVQDRTFNDHYNMEIINSRDWGKSLGLPLNVHSRPLPNQKTILAPLQQKIGSLRPRTRAKQGSLDNSFSLAHLPPPPLGQTVGHGFYRPPGLLHNMVQFSGGEK